MDRINWTNKSVRVTRSTLYMRRVSISRDKCYNTGPFARLAWKRNREGVNHNRNICAYASACARVLRGERVEQLPSNAGLCPLHDHCSPGANSTLPALLLVWTSRSRSQRNEIVPFVYNHRFSRRPVLTGFPIFLSDDRRRRGHFERAHSQAGADPRPGPVDRVL